MTALLEFASFALEASAEFFRDSLDRRLLLSTVLPRFPVTGFYEPGLGVAGAALAQLAHAAAAQLNPGKEA